MTFINLEKVYFCQLFRVILVHCVGFYKDALMGMRTEFKDRPLPRPTGCFNLHSTEPQKDLEIVLYIFYKDIR